MTSDNCSYGANLKELLELTIGNSKIMGILLSLMVLAMLALPAYAAAGNMTGNASGSIAVTINLTAKNVAFNMSIITVPANAHVTVNFDNQDSGVQHNAAFYQDQSASTAFYKGQIIIGPKKAKYTFTAPSKPGTYYFQCDVHPSQMRGQFIVK